MHPCQHCYAPMENQQRVCPTCGGSQVPSVGLHAPPVSIDADDPDDAFEQDERIISQVRRLVLLATFVVPFFGWLGGGIIGLVLCCITLAIFLAAAVHGGGLT